MNITLGKAIDIANANFDERTDVIGRPYVLRLLAVMQRVERIDIKSRAILHNVLKETCIEVEDLSACGASEKDISVLEDIAGLSSMEKEKLASFEKRVSTVSTDAIVIKIAYLLDLLCMENDGEAKPDHRHRLNLDVLVKELLAREVNFSGYFKKPVLAEIRDGVTFKFEFRI